MQSACDGEHRIDVCRGRGLHDLVGSESEHRVHDQPGHVHRVLRGLRRARRVRVRADGRRQRRRAHAQRAAQTRVSGGAGGAVDHTRRGAARVRVVLRLQVVLPDHVSRGGVQRLPWSVCYSHPVVGGRTQDVGTGEEIHGRR